MLKNVKMVWYLGHDDQLVLSIYVLHYRKNKKSLFRLQLGPECFLTQPWTFFYLFHNIHYRSIMVADDQALWYLNHNAHQHELLTKNVCIKLARNFSNHNFVQGISASKHSRSAGIWKFQFDQATWSSDTKWN